MTQDYSVKLSPDERDILASLHGCPLHCLLADGWSAEIQSEDLRVSIVPVEEATPDAQHPYGDVERPAVRAVDASQLGPGRRVLGEQLGRIHSVSVLSILVGFTPVTLCRPTKIGKVRLPAGYGYGHVYYPPDSHAEARSEAAQGALIDLDIAIELTCDTCPGIVLYTRGFFINVSLKGPPNDEEWVKCGAFVRRKLRLY